jgi:hypothetical protein
VTINDDIVVDWKCGTLMGAIMMIDDHPFADVVLVREPTKASSDVTLRAIEPGDDLVQRQIDHFQQAADKGVIYRGDAERHNPEFRQAMADWWRAVGEWIEKQRADRG